MGQGRANTRQLHPQHIRPRLPDITPRIRPHFTQELLPRRRLDMIEDLERLCRDVHPSRRRVVRSVHINLRLDPHQRYLDLSFL